MKKWFLALTVLVATNVLADVSGEYTKKNADVDIKQKGNAVEFSISLAIGQHPCSLEGVAAMIDANRAAYTSDVKSDQCAVMFMFSGGALKITTKDCNEFCGLNAIGYIDGTYKEKGKK